MPAGKIRIVTDSSAQFLDPAIIQRHNITVIPLGIQMGERLYREDVELSAQDFFQRLSKLESVPELVAPTVEEFVETYKRLGQETKQILSIHISRAMHPTWQNAKQAKEAFIGGCEIAVLDSQTTSVGLGMLVEAAAQLTEEYASLDDVVRAVRKLIPHIYAIFCVEMPEYLRRNELLSESQAVIGKMMGIKPFIAIEEGELIAIEKVRSQHQAVDQLMEFVSEFRAVDQLVILHTRKASDITEMLQERLAAEFSEKPLPLVDYKPSLATYIGPHAVGIIVFETELDDTITPDGDDFYADEEDDFDD